MSPEMLLGPFQSWAMTGPSPRQSHSAQAVIKLLDFYLSGKTVFAPYYLGWPKGVSTWSQVEDSFQILLEGFLSSPMPHRPKPVVSVFFFFSVLSIVSPHFSSTTWGFVGDSRTVSSAFFGLTDFNRSIGRKLNWIKIKVDKIPSKPTVGPL